MGFRVRKSFKVAPGVRMTVSRSGVGYSVGRKGMRVTKTARGRVVTTVGIPGSGLSYARSGGTRRSATRSGNSLTGAQETVRHAPTPGLFAPKAEKALHRALIQKQDFAQLERIAREHPEWAPLCATIDGLLAYEGGDIERAEPLLDAAFRSGEDGATHPFMQKYAGASTVTLELADGVNVTMPLGREAVGLTLAELYQATGRLTQAIEVVEHLDPTFTAAVSLAELYSDAGRTPDVIELTNGVTNESDAHAFLLVLRARALREQGMFDAAREALKEAIRRRSVDPEIRRRGYLERANNHLAQGHRAQARKDLERIYAEDANYPGLIEAMTALDAEMKPSGE